MALRIIEAHVAPDLSDEAREILGEFGHEHWVQEGGRFGAIVFAILGRNAPAGLWTACTSG